MVVSEVKKRKLESVLVEVHDQCTMGWDSISKSNSI